MKKQKLGNLLLVAVAVCLLNVAASAGWADSVGRACDPATSPKGTCIYTDDKGGRSAADKPDNSTTDYIKTMIAEYVPFIYFLH